MSDLRTVAEAPTKVTSHMIKLGIRNSFASGYQTFFEVGNDTGAKVRRHADAVSIGIWPSTGHRIHGYEVKVSRADFINEMKNGDKAQAIFQFCHHWSLATPPGLIKVDELPPTWGLVTFDGKILRTVKPAPRLEPAPLTPGFVAAMVRRAGEMDSDLIAEAQNKTRLEMEGRFKEQMDRRVKQHGDVRTEEFEAAVRFRHELREAIGDDYLSVHGVPNLAAAYRLVRKSNIAGGGYATVENLLRQMEEAAARIREALAKTAA